MFPNLAMRVEDVCWMGDPRGQCLVAVRWGAVVHHRGHGPYGPPTGREVHLWGITQWHIEASRVRREWTTFNEFGILLQLFGPAARRPSGAVGHFRVRPGASGQVLADTVAV